MFSYEKTLKERKIVLAILRKLIDAGQMSGVCNRYPKVI